MSQVPGAAAATSSSSVDVYSMDVETAMLIVMIGRTDALDDTLRVYMDKIQSQNDQMALLNECLKQLNNILAKYGSSDTAKYSDSSVYGANNQPMYDANEALKAANVQPFVSTQNGPLDPLKGGGTWPGGLVSTNVKGDVNAAITTINNLVTEISNNQQIDMINLQSTSNKRDESYNIMTNWIKSIHESLTRIANNI